LFFVSSSSAITSFLSLTKNKKLSNTVSLEFFLLFTVTPFYKQEGQNLTITSILFIKTTKKIITVRKLIINKIYRVNKTIKK